MWNDRFDALDRWTYTLADHLLIYLPTTSIIQKHHRPIIFGYIANINDGPTRTDQITFFFVCFASLLAEEKKRIGKHVTKRNATKRNQIKSKQTRQTPNRPNLTQPKPNRNRTKQNQTKSHQSYQSKTKRNQNLTKNDIRRKKRKNWRDFTYRNISLPLSSLLPLRSGPARKQQYIHLLLRETGIPVHTNLHEKI